MVDVFSLRLLLVALVGWLDQRQQEAVAYLIEENRILRGQLRGRRLPTQGVAANVIYDGTFATPKRDAGRREIPLSDAALQLLKEWKQCVASTEPAALVFSTRGGHPISPNNVLRRAIFPACDALSLPHATWLTFRRTYSSWSHDKGVPAKVIAQLMGHANVDTTLNVYTEVLDRS